MLKNSSPNSVPLVRVILYVRDMEKSAEFYKRYFGFQRVEVDADDLIHLESPENGGFEHPAGREKCKNWAGRCEVGLPGRRHRSVQDKEFSSWSEVWSDARRARLRPCERERSIWQFGSDIQPAVQKSGRFKEFSP